MKDYLVEKRSSFLLSVAPGLFCYLLLPMAGLDGLLVAMGGMGRTPTRGQVDVVLNGIFFSPDTLGKRAKNVVISIANISDNNETN